MKKQHKISYEKAQMTSVLASFLHISSLKMFLIGASVCSSLCWNPSFSPTSRAQLLRSVVRK